MASEAGDACPSHAQHTRRRGILPRVARTRKRFWAWTLTLTAALLAVVWVGSIRYGAELPLTPKFMLVVFEGLVGFFADPTPCGPFESSLLSRSEWTLRWWFWWAWIDDALEFGIPLWPFILLTSVPGVWMLVKTRKHTNPHACPACGYDRTGLPQTSTGPAPCPECGKSA
mgnify:CR=1 FL=1